jgi:dUTP pyrophosphatase
MVKTGLSVELPVNTEIQVRPRSGLASKFEISITNSPGTIDTGYRGPCNVLLKCTWHTIYEIKKGDKIAQFVVSPKMPYKFVEVDELTDTERGEGGFGHTGK